VTVLAVRGRDSLLRRADREVVAGVAVEIAARERGAKALELFGISRYSGSSLGEELGTESRKTASSTVVDLHREAPDRLIGDSLRADRRQGSGRLRSRTGFERAIENLRDAVGAEAPETRRAELQSASTFTPAGGPAA
jgi:hypothetical protein